MNVFFKIKHQQLYDAVLATPMMPGDVALGEIGWAVSRGLIYSTTFMLDDVGARAWSARRGSCWPCRRAR